MDQVQALPARNLVPVDSLPDAPPAAAATTGIRLDSIDLLRGLVMVLMALDHTRDFFTRETIDPLDLTRTNAALFFTRWITHYCAPVFVFLAGTGAFFSRHRGKTALAQFLFTRGLWLVFLELTVVRCLGWFFNFDFHFNVVGVLWAIGWSMVVLAALIHLPLRWIAVFGIATIAAHNLLDHVPLPEAGLLRGLWSFLHVPAELHPAAGYRFAIAYPLIPWVGVMACGFAFGSIMLKPAAERRRWLWALGLGLTIAFVLLRLANGYGNPDSWQPQKNGWFTLFSFLHVHKYPPSLLYVLMTLGPALIFLALVDRGIPRWTRPIIVFGRVPLFYYLLHLPLIHGLAVIVAYARFGRADWFFANPPPNPPPGNGFALPVVYGVWLLVIVMLYPVCSWFARLKQNRRDPWLGYL